MRLHKEGTRCSKKQLSTEALPVETDDVGSCYLRCTQQIESWIHYFWDLDNLTCFLNRWDELLVTCLAVF